MKKYLLTITENKYDSIENYIIDEKSIPVGTTIENVVEKIVASIVVGSEDLGGLIYACKENNVSWVVQFEDYHYNIVLQEEKDFNLDIFGDLAIPIRNRDKLWNILNEEYVKNYSRDIYVDFVEEIKNAAGIQNLKGKFNFG